LADLAFDFDQGDMYRDASRVLDQLLHGAKKRQRGAGDGPAGGLGLKALALSDKVKNKSKTYAVVCETLKYRDAIDHVLRIAELDKEALARSEGLLYVMLYDHLWGKGIQGGGAVKRTILSHDTALRAALQKVVEVRGASDASDLVAEHVKSAPDFPRFARVNLLRATVNQATEAKLHKSVSVDPHIPYVLRFPPKTDLHAHPWVEEGKLILQDKSSCFPAHALYLLAKERLGGADQLGQLDALDATAAPGNKTSQLASLGFRNVLAFDKSARRLKVLERRMEQAGAQEKVRPECRDFLSSDGSAAEFAHVKVILLDPSCSGSGMVGRVDHLAMQSSQEEEESERGGEPVSSEKDRILRLQKFQVDCLKHALSFPAAELVSYSTCSVHDAENEQVVMQALEAHPEWELCKALPQWPRRGKATAGTGTADEMPVSAEQADRMVRVDPMQDETCGFFVAVLGRKQDAAVIRRKAKMKERRKKRRGKRKAQEPAEEQSLEKKQRKA